jgi:hypothetical protein
MIGTSMDAAALPQWLDMEAATMHCTEGSS